MKKPVERGTIPAGTRIKLFEGRVTLQEDVVVAANQEWIDKAIKDQEDYFSGINTESEPKSPVTIINTDIPSMRLSGAKLINKLVTQADLTQDQLDDIKLFLNPCTILDAKRF